MAPLRPEKIAAVIVAAGMGTRAKLGYNKILHQLGACTVIEQTVRKFIHLNEVVLVCSAENFEQLSSMFADCKTVKPVLGGGTRTESVRLGFKAVAPDTDIVAVHDGARPFVTLKTIEDSILSAHTYGSGIAAVQQPNAIKIIEDGIPVSVPREHVFIVQTPQAFRFSEITDAYARISGNFADDSEVYERAGYRSKLVEGAAANRKLTDPADFLAPAGYKTGLGFDVHRLIEGRPLILGGVHVPYTLGLLGHSDADVLTHAVMDALLSAAGERDIGCQFPDTDPQYKNADSIELLKTVVRRVETACKITSVSACILAQAPKLNPHIPAMRTVLSAAMQMDIRALHLSATTTETLGIIGAHKGIAALAAVTVQV